MVVDMRYNVYKHTYLTLDQHTDSHCQSPPPSLSVTSLPSILAGVVLSLLETVSDYINQNNKDVDQKEPSLHTTADYTQDTTPIR